MFERFTERARQVIVFAQVEARELRHNYIGTEHLLLGLLREDEGVAARVLVSLDISVEEVRAQIARIVGQGDEVTTGMIPFTPRAKKVLELSLREALSRGHDYIGTEHILLAIAAENEGVASRILLDFDADAEKIRGEVTRSMIGKGPSERERREPAEPMETFPPITYAEMGPPGHSRMHLSSEVSFGGQAPWWHRLAERAPIWLGMVVGALLFSFGLLVGRLIWG